jgi:hypothetical protein
MVLEHIGIANRGRSSPSASAPFPAALDLPAAKAKHPDVS